MSLFKCGVERDQKMPRHYNFNLGGHSLIAEPTEAGIYKKKNFN